MQEILSCAISAASSNVRGVPMQGLETNTENVEVGKQAAEYEILATIQNATLIVHCAWDCSNTVHHAHCDARCC